MNSCDGNSFSLTVFLSFVFVDYPAKNRATRFVCLGYEGERVVH